MKQKLLVLSTKKALVCQFEKLPSVRYVGYKYNQNQLNDEGKVCGGYVQVDKEIELPYMVEYIKALKCGDLLPADAETASIAGLNYSYKK